MNTRNEGGVSLADTFLEYGRQTGRAHPDLKGPPCPSDMAYLMSYFTELSHDRMTSGFGPGGISGQTIIAWSDRRGWGLSSLELEAIRALDIAYQRIYWDEYNKRHPKK